MQSDKEATPLQLAGASLVLLLVALIGLPITVGLFFGAAWGWFTVVALCVVASVGLAVQARRRFRAGPSQ